MPPQTWPRRRRPTLGTALRQGCSKLKRWPPIFSVTTFQKFRTPPISNPINHLPAIPVFNQPPPHPPSFYSSLESASRVHRGRSNFMQRTTTSHPIRNAPLSGRNSAREKFAFRGPQKTITSRAPILFFIGDHVFFAQAPISPAQNPLQTRRSPRQRQSAMLVWLTKQ